MIKSRFSDLKWTAVVAVLAITVIAGVRPSTATKQPPLPATAAPDADLANEERALAKYFDDLVAYQNECAKLGERPVLEHIHINPVQAKSDDLKSRLPGLQNTIREIVKKLKAANEWDNLDTNIAAKITDGTSNTFFKQTSFKQLLEEFSNTLISSYANEISRPLDNLRKKLTSQTFSPYGAGADLQIVRAAYVAPAPMSFGTLRCQVGMAIIVVEVKLGRTPTQRHLDRAVAGCGVTPAT